MNVDAQEAALGLLSMGNNYLSQPIPSTSSATLNSILTTTASPVIPQKRKQSDIDQPEFTGNHVESLQQQQHPYLRLTHSPPAEPSPRSNGAECNDPHDTSTETVDCICGFAVDDGFSIACDECSRWCHSACFDIAPGSVPEKFTCWTCKPRSAVEKEKAVRLQRERLGMADGDGKEAKQRRRSSPGLERRQRRGPSAITAAAPVDGAGPGKRKRRPSMTQQPPTPIVIQATPNGVPDEEQIDVDSEPWREYYVHIVQDIIPNDDTRAKLRHQAAHWRGVTAVSTSSQNPAVIPPSSLETPPPVSVKPLSPQSSLNPFLSQNSNPLVLPPAFSLHTTQAIPSHSLITPFHSCITPSSTYLADPLNAYAHLGMPKPYVHLLGPPLDVALDARIVGNHGRFARWGCKPNAVLRPIVCERGSNETDDGGTLGFGVFATKDMKANEEIILGWEWDDGNAVHLLPALLEAPETFPLITTLSTNRLHKIQHIKNQMSNILHALSSTFTTCACGALSKDCALTQMAAFVDGHDLGSLFRRKDQANEVDSDDDIAKIDIGPLVGRKRGFRTKERIPYSGGLGGMQMVADEDVLGNGKGFVWDGRRYKEGVPPSSPTLPFSPGPTKRGKERSSAVDEDADMIDAPTGVGDGLALGKRSNNDNLIVSSPTPSSEAVDNPPSEPRPPDPPDGGGDGDPVIDETEERMPPKMRKKWMHRELEARKEPLTRDCQVVLGRIVNSYDEHQLMPPPPMPAALDPTTISSNSATRLVSASHHSPTRSPSTTAEVTTMSPPPSTSGVSPLALFAQLSLLSPALLSEIQPEPSTQDQGKPEKGSQEGPKTHIAEESQPEASVAVLSLPEGNPSTTLISSVSEDSVLGDASINSPPPILNSHAPEFSRTLPTYSRRHDEDDEVDYSPHSPEPSFEDTNIGKQSSEVLPQPNTSVDLISHSVLDNVDECDDVKPQVDVQAALASNPPLPMLSPPLSTIATPGLEPTNSVQEPSLKAPSQELQCSHPPLPKVKLTLKDFALRRKRQREEQALSHNIQASPVTPSPLLPLEGEEELKSPNIVKTQQEVSGKEGCVITSDNNPNGHVINGPGGEFTLEIKSKENSTSCNDSTAMRKENEIRTDINSHQPALSPTTPFPMAAASNGRPPFAHNLPNRPPPPLILPPRPIQHPAIPKTNARDLKQELIETLVPPLLQRVSGVERSVSPISPDPTPMGNRIAQEEEGEIGETAIALRGPLGSSSKRDPNLQTLSRNAPPFSHSPPIGPRFYLNQPTSPTSIRPIPPSMSPVPSVPANNTNGNRPNLPTAPRALRQSMLHHRSGSGPIVATHSPSLLLPPHDIAPGSPFIPRGPSADRDKERDRADWDRRHYRAPRRGTGNGRGTPWGR